MGGGARALIFVGRVTRVGEVGACASVFGWRFCFWRAGMVVGGGVRVPRSSGGALCLAGGEGEGGARSSTFGWRVVKRAGIGGGSALIDMVVAFCLAGGEEWWKRAHRYARDVCIWRGGEWWCGGVGARSSVYGWRVVFSGVEGSTRSSIVGVAFAH